MVSRRLHQTVESPRARSSGRRERIVVLWFAAAGTAAGSAISGGAQTKLQAIGGRITVSSFQKGWKRSACRTAPTEPSGTRAAPALKPPHFVVLENPRGKSSMVIRHVVGRNGNGLVKGT